MAQGLSWFRTKHYMFSTKATSTSLEIVFATAADIFRTERDRFKNIFLLIKTKAVFQKCPLSLHK